MGRCVSLISATYWLCVLGKSLPQPEPLLRCEMRTRGLVHRAVPGCCEITCVWPDPERSLVNVCFFLRVS